MMDARDIPEAIDLLTRNGYHVFYRVPAPGERSHLVTTVDIEQYQEDPLLLRQIYDECAGIVLADVEEFSRGMKPGTWVDLRHLPAN